MPATTIPHPRLHHSIRIGVLAAVLFATVALIANRPAEVTAQSATPVATVACADPGLVPAPEVPAAVSAGSPVASPAAVTGADPATSEAITSVIDALAACLTAGNPETVAQLVTDRYLADAYGGGERMTKEDYIALAPLAPVVPVTIVSIGEIGLTASDTATVAVVTIQGNQLRNEEWTFLFRRSRQSSATPVAGGEGHWLVHQVAVLTPSAPGDASTASAELQNGAITVTPDTIDGPDIAITIENTSDTTHEFLTLRLVEGATLDQLIRPTSDAFPSNIEFIGQETVPAGETSTLILVGLEPGEYTVVCLLPDADGVPHLALGETTTFTVE